MVEKPVKEELPHVPFLVSLSNPGDLHGVIRIILRHPAVHHDVVLHIYKLFVPCLYA